MTTSNRKILISGAGIGGPALAYWLKRYGFEPVLIERAPAFRDGGYMLDVWGVGHELIEHMGLIEAAHAKAYFIEHVWIVDETGKKIAGFDGEVFARALGGKFFSIPRGDLALTIYDAVRGDVETHYATSIKSLREDANGVAVEFDDGRTQTFDLVIGADGLRSRVRNLAFGDDVQFEKYLGYYAASFVTNGYPHRNLKTYLSFAEPGRQIARYAMRGDKSAFLMVFAEKEELHLPPHDMAAHKTHLRKVFGGDGWETPDILDRMDAAHDVYFDAVSQIRMPSWSRGRVALLGDAAHCPSLLAGAGSAFAMLGAYILAGELKTSGGDHVAAFASYESRMRPFIERQQKSTVGFARAFAPQTRFGLWFRNRVFNLMRIGWIADWYTRSSLSAGFDLPDYL
jgi:2-polyprenyl-6-methoxyphenol hydroxylase-like FAD-dependent oxidoreductase